jgi:thiamine kinase-like enzyme
MIQKTERIQHFLQKEGWLVEPVSCEFLKAGEYNENYIVKSSGKKYVFRINHGSQLGLQNQIEYEYRVLKALQNSDVTARPFYYKLADNAWLAGNGVMLLEYLPGRPLSYTSDLKDAAFIFSCIHSQPKTDHFIIQAEPIKDIASESYNMLNKYPNHPLNNHYKKLLLFRDEILLLWDKYQQNFYDEEMVIVNTEVNSHNFLINDHRSYLIDWEKALISYRYQDLGHFICPTTTMWKQNYLMSEKEKKEFVMHYKSCIHAPIDFDELWLKTKLLEKTIILRGLSWCFMAYYEYTQESRKIRNNDTFSKIKEYMENLDDIIELK